MPRIGRLSGVPETSLPVTWLEGLVSGTDEPLGTPWGAEQGQPAPPHLTYRYGDQAVCPGWVRAHQVLGQPGVEAEPAGRAIVSAGQRQRFPNSLPVSLVPT